MAFPVRFEAEGETVQTTTRELDERGVFVRCVEPPSLGALVALTLYLPGAPGGDALKGIVNESVELGPGSGFRADFVALPEEARLRIVGVLGAAARPKAVLTETGEYRLPGEGRNRRLLPRYLDRFQVTLTKGEQAERLQSINLSASGLFVQSDAPPEMDSIVQVVLDLPDQRPPAQVQAIVVHRVGPESTEAGPCGVGVQFIGADDDFRLRLDAYLGTLVGKPAG